MTPQELQEILEWAGARLVAMPVRDPRPQQFRGFWPEYNRDKFELTEFRARISLRALAPDKDEIPIMDEILLLPAILTDQWKRRILQYRALVHPINNRHLRSWDWIAKRIGDGCTAHKAKRLHLRALDEVIARTPSARLQAIANSLRNTFNKEVA